MVAVSKSFDHQVGGQCARPFKGSRCCGVLRGVCGGGCGLCVI